MLGGARSMALHGCLEPKALALGGAHLWVNPHWTLWQDPVVGTHALP